MGKEEERIWRLYESRISQQFQSNTKRGYHQLVRHVLARMEGFGSRGRKPVQEMMTRRYLLTIPAYV